MKSFLLLLLLQLLTLTVSWNTYHIKFPNAFPQQKLKERRALLRVKTDFAHSQMQIVHVKSDLDIGFSFSVAGLLFPYHLGVADKLKESQLLVQGTPLSGSSGGALAATLIALSFSGLDIDRVLDTTQAAYSELRCPAIYSFFRAHI